MGWFSSYLLVKAHLVSIHESQAFAESQKHNADHSCVRPLPAAGCQEAYVTPIIAIRLIWEWHAQLGTAIAGKIVTNETCRLHFGQFQDRISIEKTQRNKWKTIPFLEIYFFEVEMLFFSFPFVSCLGWRNNKRKKQGGIKKKVKLGKGERTKR